jgi:hypothetical protein
MICRLLLGRRATLALLVFSLAGAIVVPQPALGHPGHSHATAGDGRIKGLADLERIGDTTYRYLPARGEYEMTRPGAPRSFMHADPSVAEEQAEFLDSQVSAEENSFLLPENELAPVCRTSGNRIVIVSSTVEGTAPKDYTAKIRQIVRRMNWKIADQASKSSNGERIVRMAVDCNATGEINVHYVQSKNEEWPRVLDAAYKVYGDPENDTSPPDPTKAVKYLNFAQQVEGGAAGVARMMFATYPERSNPIAGNTGVGAVHPAAWERHTPIHELFHTLGAVQGSAPYSNGSGHCDDGIDVMCQPEPHPDTGLIEYVETRCPASEGYATSLKRPIDCGNDTYFDAIATPSSWLATHWNVGSWEDPYLVADPKATTSAATETFGKYAKLHGSVHPEGTDTSYWFEWATDAEYKASGYTHTTSGGKVGWGGSPVSVTEQLSALSPTTTYHYRLVAENEAAKVVGADQQFTTTKAPIVSTGESTPKGATAVTLAGSVNPNGLEASYYFEYDTKAYGVNEAPHGTAVPASAKAIGSGTSPVAVSEEVKGLPFDTAYHYRLVAVSVGGNKYYGEDRSFSTPDSEVPRIEAEATPARIRGEQTVAKGFQVKMGNLLTQCQTVNFDGAKLHQASTRDVYLKAEPASCEFNGTSATVEMKSCHYVLGVRDAGPPYLGAVGVECVKAGDVIQITAGNCTAQIGEQDGAGGVTLAAEGTGTARRVLASLATSGLSYQVTKDGFLCAFSGTGSFSDGALAGTIALRSESDAAQPIGLFAEGSQVTLKGYYATGTPSESEALRPRLASEVTPSRVSGRQLPIEELTFGPGSTPLRCNLAELSGAQAATSATQLELQASYQQCDLGGISASVNMGSCGYSVSVANSGPPYSGSLTIQCAEPGDAVEVIAGTCAFEIGPQGGIGGIVLATRGASAERRVLLEAASTGLSYQVTKDGFLCPLSGTGSFANGTFSGGALLAATPLEGIGVYMAGQQSGTESQQPKLEAEYLPAQITAAVGAGDQLTLQFGTTIACTAGDFTLSGQLTAASGSLSLDPDSGSCSASTMQANSCGFGLQVENSGPPYAGSFELDCAEAGDEIEITSGTCTVGVGEQTIDEVGLSTEGFGGERGVVLGLAAEGIDYRVVEDGLFCPLPPEGKLSDGTMTGDLTLFGSA